MRDKLPVHWNKGMLLLPHHLQQADRHIAATQFWRLRTLFPFCYGFNSIAFDRDALANGRILLRSAEGILPDGHYFSIPDYSPSPPAVAVENRFPQETDRITVYIGLRRASLDRPAVSVKSEGQSVDARYSIEEMEASDENTATNARTILVRRDAIRILLPDDALGEYEYLPAAELVRSPEGGVQTHPGFVPPCLQFAASERLQELTRKIYEMCLTASNNLAEKRTARMRGMRDLAVEDASSLLLLQTLNSSLPLIAHAIRHPRAHPEGVYRSMTRLFGALTAFTSEISLGDIPAYDHDKLGKVFEDFVPLARKIPEFLPKFSRIQLKVRDGIFHHGEINDDRILATGSSLYLGVRAEIDPSVLIDRVPKQCKVASGERIEDVAISMLDGVILSYAPNLPPALPVKTNRHIYFSLSTFGEYWEGIRRSRTIAVYFPETQLEPDLDLVALLP